MTAGVLTDLDPSRRFLSYFTLLAPTDLPRLN